MKKWLFTILMLSSVLSMDAQMFIQGTFGMTYQHFEFEEGNSSVSSCFIIPGLGYQFSDKWSLALDLGVGTTKASENDAVNKVIVSPYVRYTYAEFRDVMGFFIDGVYEYSHSSQDNAELNAHATALRPGICYKLNDRWNLVASIVLFSYTYNKESEANAMQFSVNPYNASFGIKYSF